MASHTRTWLTVVLLLILSSNGISRGQSYQPSSRSRSGARAVRQRGSSTDDFAPSRQVSNNEEPLGLSEEESAPPAKTEASMTTTTETTECEPLSLNYDLAGPYSMRSADPEETGELEFKNIFGWSTSKGGDDDFEYEFEVEWGFAHDHELIFEVPVALGDGRVEGNGDAEIGWHWRLWEEKDWLPAFAMRNFVRLPTGVDSNGVDYELIGLFTKSIIPGKLRFNANPFLKSVNGDNEEDARHFLWGGTFGVDCRVQDNVVLTAGYRYQTGEIEGTRDNHQLELGGEWEIVEHHELGFAVDVGLDGDSNGPALGARLSYIISF